MTDDKIPDIDQLEYVNDTLRPTKDHAVLRDDADQATAEEHSTTVLGAARRYPKAVAWSAIVSLCIIMDGYDSALMGSFFGFPAFQKYYGHPIGKGKYQLEPSWQSALGTASSLGNIVGVTLNGVATDRFGHKPVLICSMIALTGLVFIQFFATDVRVLFTGQLLCGIPWGIFSTLSPGYASEIAPLALRSYFETWVVCCWGIGQFLSYAALFTLRDRADHWAFRIPFAVQWIWPVLILPIVVFCPESPWWYVRQGRLEDAKKSIQRLMSDKTSDKAAASEKQLALMVETNSLEKEANEGTSYLDCFKGADLWRTEVGCFSWGSQILTGFVISGYSTYFFEQAGLASSDAFKMTLGMGGIHLLCNGASAAISGNYGRRIPYMIGCFAMGCLMILVGILASVGGSKSLGFAVSAVFLVWYAVWCLTIGPLPYVINGEVSSTRLRSKTFVLARATYIVLNIVTNVVAPYILNPTAANWGGKTGYLTGGLNFVCFVWAFWRLPETSNRTFEELDILFTAKGTNARNFGKASILRDGQQVTVN